MSEVAAEPDVGWRMRIRHHTGFAYAGPVRSSYNEARLTPLTLPGQVTLDSRVEVTPTPANIARYWDYWGSHVVAFDVHEPHDELEVTGVSVVETSPPPELPDGVEWATLRSPEARDRWFELLLPTPLTELDVELEAAALAAAADREPVEAALAVMAWVRETVAYVRGATGVRTSAREAYEQRSGVCQDLAHLSAGMLRSLGVPARYVSGYVYPRRDAEVGVTVEGQSHSWVEVWLGRWVGFDPTHGIPVGSRHVLVARGRDYDDVPPLRGVYQGASSALLGVGVELTRLS